MNSNLASVNDYRNSNIHLDSVTHQLPEYNPKANEVTAASETSELSTDMQKRRHSISRPFENYLQTPYGYTPQSFYTGENESTNSIDNKKRGYFTGSLIGFPYNLALQDQQYSTLPNTQNIPPIFYQNILQNEQPLAQSGDQMQKPNNGSSNNNSSNNYPDQTTAQESTPFSTEQITDSAVRNRHNSHSPASINSQLDSNSLGMKNSASSNGSLFVPNATQTSQSSSSDMPNNSIYAPPTCTTDRGEFPKLEASFSHTVKQEATQPSSRTDSNWLSLSHDSHEWLPHPLVFSSKPDWQPDCKADEAIHGDKNYLNSNTNRELVGSRGSMLCQVAEPEVNSSTNGQPSQSSRFLYGASHALSTITYESSTDPFTAASTDMHNPSMLSSNPHVMSCGSLQVT